MKIDLFLISPYEEYPNKHICRRHWNYEWRGRRGTHFTENKTVKLRKESFGGLLQAVDGKIFKLDNSAYDFIKQYRTSVPIEKICKSLNISIEEGHQFTKQFDKLGV